MGGLVVQGLEGGWKGVWHRVLNLAGTGLERGLEAHHALEPQCRTPAAARNVRRLDGGPSCSIAILPLSNKASIAAFSTRFVHPLLTGCMILTG